MDDAISNVNSSCNADGFEQVRVTPQGSAGRTSIKPAHPRPSTNALATATWNLAGYGKYCRRHCNTQTGALALAQGHRADTGLRCSNGISAQ